MGFGTTGNQKKWITIKNGNLTVRAQEGEEGAVERKWTIPKTGEKGSTWEFQYPTFTGFVRGAEFDNTDYGVVFAVDMFDKDSGDTYQLRIDVNSRIFSQFAKRIPNIDVEKELTIGAGLDKEKGDATFIYMKQDGEAVKFAFTKDNPNGLPAPEKKTRMGKDVWDFSAQEEFLYNLCDGWFTSQMNKLADSYKSDDGLPEELAQSARVYDDDTIDAPF